MKKLIAVILSSALLATSNLVMAEKPADCKVNINTATASQLEDCLDRVGEKLANAIVEWRDEAKKADEKFLITDVDQLVGKVSRWGKKTAEMNKAKVCFTEKDCKGEKVEDAPKVEPKIEAAPKVEPPVKKVKPVPADDGYPSDNRW